MPDCRRDLHPLILLAFSNICREAAVYKVTEFGLWTELEGVIAGEANLAPLPGHEKEQKTVVDVLEACSHV